MMGKRFKVEKYVTPDATAKKAICLIKTCKRTISLQTSNVIRHYKLVHKVDIRNEEESETAGNRSKTPLSSKIRNIKLRTNLDKNDFLQCCVGLVTKKNLPFTIFDDEEFFKPLISPYEAAFNVNLNPYNIGHILENKCLDVKSKISSLVKDKMICLKFDIASRMDRTILGINIQYIEDYKICINTIGVIQTTKRNTAANLKDEILKCLEEFNIGLHQIYSSTIDNGANVLKVPKMLQEMQSESMENEEVVTDTADSNQIESNLEQVFSVVRCAAHAVQLAAHDVIETFNVDIEECRKMLIKIRNSVRSEDNNISLPNLDVIMRWNSTFTMLENILFLKEFIESSENLRHININWGFLKRFVKAFQPLEKCTLKLQTEQYILGDFFRDWLTCELELEELSSTNKYATALLNAMRKRKLKLLEYNAFTAALFLDPRFNFRGTPFLTDDNKKNAFEHLLKVHEKISKMSDNSNEEQSETDSISLGSVKEEEPTSSCSEYDFLDLYVKKNTQSTSSQNSNADLRQKLMKLCERERVSFTTNVLLYWREFRNSDKDMAQLVETVLSVPATQVSVERSFNALSTILTQLRSNTSKKSLSNLLIVKLNYDILNFSNCDIVEESEMHVD